MATSEEHSLIVPIDDAATSHEINPRRKRIRRLAEIGLAFAVVFAVMYTIEFAGPAILDNDGYYHIKWSRMLRDSAPHLPEFNSLPLTTLNERQYADHHFLFHVLLIPFTYGDLRPGAKQAAVFFSSLALTTLFWLLLVYKIRFRWLWLALLIGSAQPFLYRMSMTRAPGLSIVLLGLGCYLILERKYLLLAVLGFVFVWSYSLFPLLFVFALAYAVAEYLSSRGIDLKPALASLVGIAAGLVINPYFPKNVSLMMEHALMKLPANYSVSVGVEWYPYETWPLAEWSGLALIVFLAGLFAFDFKRTGADLKPLFFLIISTVFLVMLFKSRRFVEYFPPFAVLFAAFTIAPRIESAGEWRPSRLRDKVIFSIGAGAAGLVLVIWIGSNVWGAYTSVRDEDDPFKFKGAAEWLASNTPVDSMVFNTDWDQFPMLFYYNSHNRFITGLDPTYLYNRDPDLWSVYEKVVAGDQSAPARAIRERFGAEYVVTENRRSDFMDSVDETEDFERVYSDPNVAVLKIR